MTESSTTELAPENLEPGSVPEPADVVEPAEPADVVEPVDPAEVVEPADVAEPADVVEPADVAEPADVVEPADPADVVEPADPADVVEPVDMAEPAAGVEQAGVPEARGVTPAALPARPRVEQATLTASTEASDLLRGAVTFGRVDADGTVYVRTAAGDRLVGEFPDTAPNEALVYYVRKFEELVGQVDLFAQRLRGPGMSAKDARAGLAKLQEVASEPKAVGDLEGLTQWVARLKVDVDRRARAADAERAAAKAKGLAEREALVAEAEALAATPVDKMHFKSAMDRLREIVDEWKTRQKDGPRLDKPAEDQLWRRLSAARAIVDKARRQHAAQTAELRLTTRTAKEAIIAEAQALSTSTDWRNTSDAFRALMDRWKGAGRLQRAEDDELWAKFRDAQESFHSARSAALSAQDEEYRANLVVKEALLVEAKALLPVTNLDSAKRRLRDIQDRWDSTGRVPRSDLDRVERELQQVADSVRAKDQSRWTATNPEALARAVDVVRQLETGVAALGKDLAKAESAGDAKAAERARAALDARTAWLDQARTALADLGG